MAGYRKSARGQGLSSTSAIASRPIRPEPSDWNMMITRADPNPPQFNSGQFGRNASPDHGRESPTKVIDQG